MYEINRRGFDNASTACVRFIQMLIPVLCGVFIVFILRPYIENEGYEVLYTFDVVNKNGWLSIWLTSMLFVAFCIPVVAVICVLTKINIVFVVLQTASQCLFFAGLAYCFSYIFTSTLAGLTVVVLIFTVCQLDLISPFQVLKIQPFCRADIWFDAKVVALNIALTAICFAMGSFFNRRIILRK